MPKTVTKADLMTRLDATIRDRAAAVNECVRKDETIAALEVEVRRLFDLKDQKDETIRILRARIAELESREDRAWPGEGNAVIPQKSADWHPWR